MKMLSPKFTQLLNLPLATTTSKGIIQVGSNLSISEGVLSVPSATTSKAGVVTKTTSITSGSSNVPTGGTVYTALSNKVDKVSGKGLSTNDFTTSYKDKLDSITVIKSIGNNLILDNNGKLSCDLSGVGGQSLSFGYGGYTQSGSTMGGQSYYHVSYGGNISSENTLNDNTVIFENTNTSNPYNEDLYVYINATSVPCYDGRSSIDNTYLDYLANTISFQTNCIFAKETSYIHFYVTNYNSGATQAVRQQIGWLFGMIGARGSLKMIYTPPTS